MNRQDTDHLVAKLYTAHMADIESAPLSAALGTLCHGLLVAGHSTVPDMVDSLVNKWMAALEDQRSASLQGLLALTGSHALSQMPEDLSLSRLPLGQIVKLLQQQLQTSTDSVIQSQFPGSYHYLGEYSVLRSVVDVLIEAGKLGPEVTSTPCVEACVKSLLLGGATSQVLPPVNWASIFTPLLRMPFGAEVAKSCLQVAVQQSAAVPSAALLLSSWLLPPLYDSLYVEGQVTLLDSLPKLITTIPVEKLTEFFRRGFQWSLREHCHGDGDRVRLTALAGLWGALKVHAPPPAVTGLLYQTLQETFALWSRSATWDLDERTSLCRCLTEVPDEIIDEILQTNFATSDRTVAAMFVRCYLVAVGNQPLNWLNASIEATVCTTDM
ncbi:hypothetical protein NP493_1010g00027 [Ridgeia piscesae]|uniref:Focadhesin C-terminal domain-containing protein n=1 Tax=Ridgeia piscesae TaxID=27915 RepID=A0AAD9KIW0_RIDPI|nr:hypothetical protein NP493_1010g00027 [Ridgeia piscesae]